ncbi:sperm flagellar protein 2 isoform X1 [Histomonas meleagridis]|uniref:sperm flagellar protein 2 isoform X1 n=1 Tax=Histomonas meleagridis TaxID=135588 RepID=UPI003559DCB7|nr:sperm flagellar protein 2 isoform X1 [Histomonas meleagridis]
MPELARRRCRSVCILFKPLLFTDEDLAHISECVGFKPIFANQFENRIDELFNELIACEEDCFVFGFPHTIEEYNSLSEKFRPVPTNGNKLTNLLPLPNPSVMNPFDMIIELDISNEIILRDVLSQVYNTETNEQYDIRNINLNTESEIVKLENVPDPKFDIIQFPLRTSTMKTNFQIIQQKFSNIYHKIELNTREINGDLINKIKELVSNIQTPTEPSYPTDVMFQTLLEPIQSLSDEIKTFFVEHWNTIHQTYESTVSNIFTVINSTHLKLIKHLQNARNEMREFLLRPSSSQSLVFDFQQWHCSQVERGMRKVQKVKDECFIRLNALHDSLIQIENERKSEEEIKQKELFDIPLRTALFEIINNCFTYLTQAEIDRWTSTNSLISDLNQILTNTDLVTPIPRKKLNLYVDPSHLSQRKGFKKVRISGSNKPKTEDKTQTFESPLYEQIEGIKKYISDASLTYVHTTTPISTRTRNRLIREKNPFILSKINGTDEIISALSDDDSYLITVLEQISEMLSYELQVIQKSFESFSTDSTEWIQSNYETRKSVVETAVGYMMRKSRGRITIKSFNNIR